MSGADSSLLTTIARRFERHPGRLGKQPLRHVTDVLGPTDWATGPGDDAAVVRRPGGDLLVAGEAIYPPFVSADPFGAGVGAVVANVNDIAAMGGRPLAIVDTVVGSEQDARSVLEGLHHAADLYDVPIVGGHLTVTDGAPSLSAFIVGEVRAPLTATNVSPGQSLLLAACLEGRLRADFGFYPTYEQRGTAVRDDLDVLRRLADRGAAVAAKDVSMAGVLGTLAMLLQPSGCGAAIDLDLVPCPDDVAMDTWLEVFPSYAFLLCAASDRADECVAAFADRGLVCAQIGTIDATATLRLRSGSQEITVLDDVVASATGLNAAARDDDGRRSSVRREEREVPDEQVQGLEVEALIDRLTVEEKAALVIGADFWHTAAVDRLGVPGIMVSDGPHGLRPQFDAADHGSLAGSVPATCFPTAAALASSWNPALLAEVGAAIGTEARRWGVSVVLGPGVNIKRSPLCGRNFEYVSEDPWLAGELAAAMVRGIQAQGVGTSLKHFAANNQEHDRMRVSAEVDERTLREIYLPAFERVVTDARPWTVMSAYNRINGTYASEHRWLLTEVLRDEWGFDGVVVSDWGAVHDRVAALRAGLDLEMPPQRGVSDVAVAEAVSTGALDPAVLDEAVRRVLRLVAAAQPALRAPAEVDEDAHHALARRAARQSAVLLRNDGAVLPLRPRAGATVAVIGAFARTPRFQGAGSSQVTPTRVDVPLDALTAAVGPDVTVRFAAGVTPDGEDPARDADLRRGAAAVARDADHVVVFLGLPASYESEGYDRAHIDLPADQIALLEAVAAVHGRVVVVLANGAAVRTSTWEHHAAAILECWLSGQAAGAAVTDLLLGDVSPSGKLAETIPVRLEDTSSYLNFPGDDGVVRYGEGVFVGYRAHDALDQRVSYPFGFGLSYTTFTIDDVDVEVSGTVADGDLHVTVTASVTNTGDVAGAEVVQVYVGDVEASVARPERELKGAVKVDLEPGERRRVTVALDERAFAFWSTRWSRWVVEAGAFTIAVGASSRDLASTVTVELDAPPLVAPLTDMSPLQEWLDHPDGRRVLGADGVIPADEAVLAMVASMPMRTLAGFPFTGFDRGTLDRWLAEING